MKYSKEIIDELLKYIEAGNYVTTACECVGLSRETFYEWLKDETKSDISDTIIQKAKSKAIARNVAVIQVAEKKNWTASAWFLERKKSEDWGRKDKVEHSNKEPSVVIFKDYRDSDNGNGNGRHDKDILLAEGQSKED